MIDFESVLVRLRVQFEVTNDKEVAEKIGISPTNLYERRKRGSIPYEQIILALENSDADLHWILYGAECKKDSEPKTAFIQYYNLQDSNESVGIDCNGPYAMIQIDASMYPDVDIRSAVAIKIVDANMSPVINKDDTIMIDRSKRDIHHGKFYVVNYIGMYMVVRIFKTQFGLTLSSANPSLPAHEGVNENDVNIIGRAIYRMENIG